MRGAGGESAGNQYDDKGDLISFSDRGRRWEWERLTIETDLIPADFEANIEETQCLSLNELFHQWGRSNSNIFLIRIRLHWSLRLVHILLLLMGLPVALYMNNNSVFLAVLASIAISAIYYFVNTQCINLGKSGILNPALSVWFPFLFFVFITFIGTVLLRKLRN